MKYIALLCLAAASLGAATVDILSSKDLKEAAKWYGKAAQQGNAWSQYKLGLMYQSGDGVAADDAKAAGLFKQAAEQGNSWAQATYAQVLEQGKGIKADKAEAIKFYKLAAAQADAPAWVKDRLKALGA